MKPQEYIDKRLQDQIDWYDRKSIASQKTFKLLRGIEIVAAALIPFLSGLAINSTTLRLYATVAMGLMGVIVAIVSGFLSFGRYQENWADYRTTCESLKKERFLFETEVEPYGGDEGFQILVQRVETLISKENTNWAQYIMRPDKETEGGDQAKK